MQGTVMTLKKHFGNAGRTAEVSVYLERRMSIEKVRICTSLAPKAHSSGRTQLIGDQLICTFSVKEARPKADLPSH